MNLDWRVLLLQIIGFFILLWLLRRYLFGPVQQMLKQREEEVAAGLRAAEEAQAARAGLRAEQEKLLAEAREEGRQQIQAAVREARAASDGINEEARTEARRLLERARGQIELEREQTLIALREEVADLALRAASQAILTHLDEATHRKVADDFIASLEKAS